MNREEFKKNHKNFWLKMKNEMLEALYLFKAPPRLHEIKQMVLEQMYEKGECDYSPILDEYKCFACEIANNISREREEKDFCLYCPLDWGKYKVCEDDNSPYMELVRIWDKSLSKDIDRKLVEKYCDEIINLPIKNNICQ